MIHHVLLAGPLADPRLGAVVLPAAQSLAAVQLPGKRLVRTTLHQAVPVAAADCTVSGQLVGLDDTGLGRLDLYGAVTGMVRRAIDLPDGQKALMLDLAQPGHDLPDWDQKLWSVHLADIACQAATELFQLSTIYPSEALKARYAMLLAKAASRLRAQAELEPVALRQPGDVTDARLRQSSQPYCHYFGVQQDDLHVRRFDGEYGPLVRRAGFLMADAVTLLPYDPVRDYAMVIEQWRFGPHMRGAQNCWSLEPIAGRIDPGEAPEDAAIREAQEEARLTLHASDLRFVARSYPSPGAISEHLYSYVALCDLPDGITGIAGLEAEAEDIRSHLVRFEELLDLARTGEAQNTPLLMTIWWLAAHRDTLRAQALS
jgi:ADP-ribose pyrophosphatase